MEVEAEGVDARRDRGGPGGGGGVGRVGPPSGFDHKRFLVIIGLCGLGLGMTAPITVLFAASFGASPALAGLTWSSLAVTLLAVDLFGTAFVPRMNGRTVLWFALTTYGVGAVASAAAPNLPLMIGGRLIQGVGAAVFMGGALQVVVRFASPGEAGKAIGAFNAACFAGIAAGPLLSGSLAELGHGQFGYRFAFLVSAVVCGLVALTARFALPSIPSGRSPRLGLPAPPRARPGFRMWPPLTLGIFGEALRGGLEFTVIPLFGAQHLHLGTAVIGIGLSVLAVADILTMRYGGMLADRVGRRTVLAAALGIGVVTCAAAPWVSGAAGFVIWCAALGPAVGASWVIPAAMVVDVSTEAEPALASFRIASDVGEAIGSTATGGLVGAFGHVGAALVLSGTFAAVGAWVARLPEAAAGDREAGPAEASAMEAATPSIQVA
jgi:MFS family permease